ncbi:putative O-glycosylation ligase, exosortase A system-associated [Stakelama tenebrarum]|uniref:Putative O-glycosylation ligase, exosortase A system-associated n=1 Tax=Stakelama tenebrarum TaxID=2711215 RepID=A0A6G6YAY6_9SPHN|nr:putative O-glycosylation ligase, exosortase A system-associated [Sphingosinithalassobacter tenebrarum]QIG81987.1 putative O-glycosylation ligase, exosortase A system-associated [Sphingosinithalassobacter tenebrarum]
MRDVAFLAFLAAIFAMGFRKPFVFVLTYVYIDIVSPQRLTYLLLNSIPISMVAAGLTVLGWLALDDKRDVRVVPRQGVLLLLLLYCAYTTHNADFPIEAQDKWEWVWKALAFAIFLPLTLRTKLRIEALLLFMVLSASSIIITGGVKTALGGGGYGQLSLMADINAGLYEGSTISTVAIAIIPLILWFSRYGTIFPPDWRVRTFCYALCFACLLIPVGTSTRTGLLCIALLAILMLRDAKRRMLYIGLMGAAGVMAIPFLPSAFTQRMETIQSYQQDESASTRIAVWKWTIDYASENPLGGGFEAYRQNRIRYNMVTTEGSENNAKLDTRVAIDAGRAYHSAYFEMLGEQGYPGLLMWLIIHLGGLFRMEVLRRRYRASEGEWAWVAPLATALQHGHMIYLLGAAFIGIAFQPFIYLLIGAQIGLDSYCGRRRAEMAWRPIRRKHRHGHTEPATA